MQTPPKTLRLLSTLALSGVVQALIPTFEAAHHLRIDAEFLPTAILMPRLRAGEPADATLLTAEGIEALAQEGLVRPETARPLARSFVGLAVKAGAPHPDISTKAAFIAALAAAPSLAMSRQGASGLYLTALFDRLGIAEMIRAKATVIASGYTAELAANGQVAMALQQISELLTIPGIEIVGRLPPELGGDSIFSGAVMTAATAPEPATTLLAAIASAAALLQEKGLEPIQPGSSSDETVRR